MTLTGPKLVGALVGASLLGVVAGVTVEGWRKVRGLPPMECVADAGVRLELDAGTSSRADCAASIEHWNTSYVRVPYPVYVDGGVHTEVQTVTVLVPDVRLTGSGASSGSILAGGEAVATARATVAPGEPERHWEAGPVVLYGLREQQVLLGGAVGWSAGPFGVRAQALSGHGDFYAGGALVWRF